MSDVVVEFRVKNGRLKRAIQAVAPGESYAAFCRKRALPYPRVIEYLGMKRSPVTKDGEWSDAALDLATAVHLEPEEIWPEAMRVALSRNTGEFTVGLDEARCLTTGRHPPSQIEHRALKLLTAVLPPREALAVEAFASGEKLENIAHELSDHGLSIARTRQILHQGLRRMRAQAGRLRLKFDDIVEAP